MGPKIPGSAPDLEVPFETFQLLPPDGQIYYPCLDIGLVQNLAQIFMVLRRFILMSSVILGPFHVSMLTCQIGMLNNTNTEDVKTSAALAVQGTQFN